MLDGTTHADASAIPSPSSHATFEPVVLITATTNAVFETSVGVIHRINDRTRFVVRAGRRRLEVISGAVEQLVSDTLRQAIDVAELPLETLFDGHEIQRFGQTETEYKEWAVDRLQEFHTTTVSYTGGNNVDYEKECVPNQSDISVRPIESVYLPNIRQTTQLQAYSYPYAYYAAGPSRVTHEDGIHECVQCGETDASTFTFCENCGSINCGSHIKTERLEQEPVCTGCAVTDRFALRQKYFYDEANREAFAEAYAQMPFYEKAQENIPATVGGVIGTVVLIMLLFLQIGVL